MSGNDSSAPCPFVEIRPKVDDGSSRPRTIQAYAISVEPRQCSMVVKELSRNYPLPDDLQHLKRVKKPIPEDEEGKITNTSKKPKFSLQALVGIEKELCCGGDLEAKWLRHWRCEIGQFAPDLTDLCLNFLLLLSSIVFD